MRRLTAKQRRRDERGVTAIIVALAFTTLMAAAGLGIDTASLVFERSRAQHSADAGAVAIAYDCVAAKSTCSDLPGADGAVGTADYYAAQNSAGGTATVPAGVSPGAGSVLVRINKTVPTNFFRIFGIASKEVSAQSRASWATHPIAGDVLPWAVSLCEYAKLPIGTATVINTVVEKDFGAAMQGPLTTVYPALAPYLQTCAVPNGLELSGNPSTVTMLPGGLWMSDNGSGTNNGKLIPTKILDTLKAGANFNMNQRGKFAGNLAPGKTILIAVYAPTANYQHGGLHVNGTSTNGDVDLKLVGYAPFIVSGWCLDANNGKPTACGGAAPSTAGIAGEFTSTTQPVAGFEYGTAGGSFGAAEVKLTE